MQVRDILQERAKTHGSYDEDAAAAMALLRCMDDFGTSVLSDVQLHALHMILFKIARIVTGDPNHKDHWDDIAGYATLAADRCSLPKPEPVNGAQVLAERGTPLPKPPCHCASGEGECMVEKGAPPKFVYCKQAEDADRIASPYAKDGKKPCNCDPKNGCWQKQTGLDLSRGVYCKA